MLISNGANSDIRYNFFYPRWAYDEYRQMLSEHAARTIGIISISGISSPANEFTNSAIHLTPKGETLLANEIAAAIQTNVQIGL